MYEHDDNTIEYDPTIDPDDGFLEPTTHEDSRYPFAGSERLPDLSDIDFSKCGPAVLLTRQGPVYLGSLWLNVSESAGYIHRSRNTITNAIKNKELRAIRPVGSRQYLINVYDLLCWLESTDSSED